MSIIVGIGSAVKAVSVWAVKYKVVDTAVDLVKAKSERNVASLEARVSCLEGEVEKLKK